MFEFDLGVTYKTRTPSCNNSNTSIGSRKSSVSSKPTLCIKEPEESIHKQQTRDNYRTGSNFEDRCRNQDNGKNKEYTQEKSNVIAQRSKEFGTSRLEQRASDQKAAQKPTARPGSGIGTPARPCAGPPKDTFVHAHSLGKINSTYTFFSYGQSDIVYTYSTQTRKTGFRLRNNILSDLNLYHT